MGGIIHAHEKVFVVFKTILFFSIAPSAIITVGKDNALGSSRQLVNSAMVMLGSMPEMWESIQETRENTKGTWVCTPEMLARTLETQENTMGTWSHMLCKKHKKMR